MNLYRVTCRRMSDRHGVAYVVAADPGAAYKAMRAALDGQNLGFVHDRELRSVELLATTGFYPSTGTSLYLPTEAPDDAR
jgi:hypothetical protein